MKKLLIGLLALGTISSHAGTLISEKGLERIVFSYDSATQILSIESTTPLVLSKEIPLSHINKDRSSIKLFAAVNGVHDGDNWGPGAYPFALAYDVAMMPFKGAVKALKNKQLQKDYVTLLKAINSDEEVTVSQKRFERIAEGLN